jgi:N12 class adenine-specific DNA methylase
VRANLEAIKLVAELQSQQRQATPQEQQVLARYTGWGGLKEVFDEGKAHYRVAPPVNDLQQREYDNWEKAWGKLYDEVRDALGDKWGAAAKSILNSHYTSRTVINGIWKALQRLGFKGGVALEPSGGIGHFIGLQPGDTRGNTKWAAVELDPTSATIMAYLYPRASVQAVGFEKSRLPAAKFNLVVSNVPFAKDGPIDPRYPRFSLHNYFFARALELVRPGGLVAFITSDSTMDAAASAEARKYIAERADLVAAIRLPNTAFKANAGTEVTTDILFLRKHDGTPFKGNSWTHTAAALTSKGEPIEINEYYVANPEMMLGRMSIEGTMHRENQQALLPKTGTPLAEQMDAVIRLLPEGVFATIGTQGATLDDVVPDVKGLKEGQITFQNGVPKLVEANGSLSEVEWASIPGKVARAKDYVQLRDATRGTIDWMLNPEATAEQIAQAQAGLNRIYDRFVSRHGFVNGRGCAFLEDDGDFPMVLALEDPETRLEEVETKKGVKVQRRVTTWTKAKIFSERTIIRRDAPTRVDTLEDGYHVSMSFRGKVDVDYIEQLTGKPPETVELGLASTGLAFLNPETGIWDAAWQYKSGQVRKKLEVVKSRVGDNPLYQYNVAALESVQPAPIAPENIGFRLGSTFIPSDVIEAWVEAQLGVKSKVTFVEKTGTWYLNSVDDSRLSEKNRTLYGIHGWSGTELVSEALNLRNPTVMKEEERTNSEGKSYTAEVRDQEKTLQAIQKQKDLKELFVAWAKRDDAVMKRIGDVYNEQMNGTALPVFEPPNWTHYPGASTDIALRSHQMRVVTRMLQNSTLLAHAVGTGKTYAMITAAMEQRRLGLAKKPMIVVQNATLEQFARSFKRLYPMARILVPGSAQRDSKHRNQTMTRIATGDWDAVIVPQSFLNLLPDDPTREREDLERQIKELKADRFEAERVEGKRSVKAADLQRAIDRLEQRVGAIQNRRTDNVLTFEQLGVDSLFVDEAHEYKKLMFNTKMDNIKGLDKTPSQRGYSLKMKVRWVQEQNQGRNVVFATGTPVSNTIAEAWTMMRFVRPDVLETFGMENFDAFAANFGETVTSLEMTAGGGWKEVTRFAKYTNGPELIGAWRTVADVVTSEELNLPNLPVLKNGKTTAVVIPQTQTIAQIVRELRDTLAAFDRMSGREKRDNSHIPLVTFTRARMMSLDPRMLDASLPDEPGSKLNAAVDNIVRIYGESTAVSGAQMVFADLKQSADGVFQLYSELKRKLVERGIPESEIAVITDDIKDARREALFTKLNAGEIRVAIGSSSRMGVGVNAQEHLIALHHLDAPHRPMDVEQRNGRIIRSGNMNPVVEVLSYGVENTLDAAMFQRLAMKQRFINQILRGDITGRNFEDAANEVTLSFEEQMAAFSGDPLALEKVTLEALVRNLEAIKAGHFQQVRASKDNLVHLYHVREPFAAKAVAEAEAKAKDYAARFADEDKVELSFGERVISGRKAVVAFLDSFIEGKLDEAAKLSEDQPNTISSMRLNGVKVSMVVRGVWFKTEDGKSSVFNRDLSTVLWHMEGSGQRQCSSGSGFMSSLRGFLRSVQDAVPERKAELESVRRDIHQLSSFVQQPFAQEAELVGAKARLAEVMAKITAAPVLRPSDKAPKVVTPLGFEVQKWKPLEAERIQVLRLMESLGVRQTAFDQWHKTPKERRNTPEPLSGHLTWEAGLSTRLAEIEREMVTAARELIRNEMDKAQGGKLYSFPGMMFDPDLYKALFTFGKEVVRRLGGWGVSKAKWSAAMVREFGKGVRQFLDSTWQWLARAQRMAAIGLTPEALGHVNSIEELAGNANIPADQRPLYSPETLAAGNPSLATRMAPANIQIRVLGGSALLAARRQGHIEESTAAAAVKQQSDALWKQLVASSRSGNPLRSWGLPDWLIATPRARRFKERSIHIAARLNAVGRDAGGNFTFADFRQRSGSLSVRQFNASKLTVGDRLTLTSPATGMTETLTVGPLVTTPEGRVFYQLFRDMPAALQSELYQHFASEYPDMVWFLDMFIDPALASTRQTINGVEVPVFNRFSAAAMMADANPFFHPLEAYTPDVLVTRSLLGSIRGALSFRAGTRSPGYKYKSGSSRESGHVRDLLSGFNVRTWQMLAQRSRRQWMIAVLRSATHIRGNQVPAGWVKLETGMEELWQAVKRLRNWRSPIDPITRDPIYPEVTNRLKDDGSESYKDFFGEAATLRGEQLMLPKALVDQLIRKHAAQVEHGALYRLGAWAVRNSTRLFLVAPTTYVANVLTNDLFAMEAGTRRILSGIMGADARDLRFAREMAVAEALKWFPGLRGLADRRYRDTVATVLPDNVFADQTMLADLKMRLDEDAGSYLRQGEIGAAALQWIRYGNIDVRAKQRMAYAWLKAQAVTNARKAGLRGAALRKAVDRYLANPPIPDRATAVDVANFELLNYADTPDWLDSFASHDYSKLLLPFPRFGYHYLAKNAQRAMALRTMLSNVPAKQRADALADFLTFLMYPAGGLGILAAYAIGGAGDDDDARKRIGTSFTKAAGPDGEVVTKPIDRSLITSNRINLSAWARGLGLGTDQEDDFWLRVRNYPVIAMAGAAVLAENDARKYGAAEGARSYFSMVSDLASDFFSLGMAAKVPSKALQTLAGRPGDRMALDPYGSQVPLLAYVTDQTLDSLVPGTRQADIAIRWLDPVQRRRTASKLLDFQPGAWDAARVGHVTGLLDRLLAGEAGTTASTLPPEGKVDRAGNVSAQNYPLEQRIAELLGLNLRPVNREAYERAISGN